MERIAAALFKSALYDKVRQKLRELVVHSNYIFFLLFYVICVFLFQAGELFERVGKEQRALEAYKKGNAFRRGSYRTRFELVEKSDEHFLPFGPK